jgi:hypothetical protein
MSLYVVDAGDSVWDDSEDDIYVELLDADNL